MLHVFEVSRNDDAIMMAAIARPDTDELVGIEDHLAAAQAHDSRGPAAARVPDRAVGPAQTVRVVAAKRPFLDQQFTRPGRAVELRVPRTFRLEDGEWRAGSPPPRRAREGT